MVIVGGLGLKLTKQDADEDSAPPDDEIRCDKHERVDTGNSQPEDISIG